MRSKPATPAGRRRAGARSAHRPAAAPAPRRSPSKRPPEQKPPSRSKPRPKAARPTPKSPAKRGGKLRTRAAIGLVVIAALAVGYFGWFRDSSLVAVDDVTVRGLGGKGGGAASAALVVAAEKMTTLHVDQSRFAAVAARFPEIASVSADAGFPHAMTLTVATRPPVMIARDGGREVPVAGDGTVLSRDPETSSKLPIVAVPDLPETGALTGAALGEARVLGAAPEPLRPEISGIATRGDDGVVVKLDGGIELRFGAPAAAPAKWGGAAAVLADRRLTTLSYIDVRVPRRPAVG